MTVPRPADLAAATRASFFSAGFSAALSLAVGGAPVIFSLVAGFSAVGVLSAANGLRGVAGIAVAGRSAGGRSGCAVVSGARSEGADSALVGGEAGADGDGVTAAGGAVGVAVDRDATLGFAGGFIASRM